MPWHNGLANGRLAGVLEKEVTWFCLVQMCEKVEKDFQRHNGLYARTKLLKSCHHVILLQDSVNSKCLHLLISTETSVFLFTST